MLLAAVLAGGLVAAGCGREKEPDLVAGKTLFVQKCGACHVLQRANTQGVQGPSLDAAFGAARSAGMNEATVEGVVYEQIGNVRRGSAMPANLVTGQDRRDVAAYVGLVAAQGGQDRGELAQAGKPKQSSKPAVAKNGMLEIDADPSGALAYTFSKAEAEAGSVELVSKNEATIQHNIAVKGAGLDEKGPVVGKGGTSKVSADLKAGRYEFYCSVPGHEAGGMKGELEIK